MTFRPTVEDLLSSGKYNILKTLKYQDIIDFVFENIRLKNAATRWYFGYNLLSLISLAGFIIYSHNVAEIPFKLIFKFLFRGFITGSFFIIPVHELIHALSYLVQGAPKIHFGADLKQMIFYVSSDKYVIGRKGFYGVAFSPFVSINLFAVVMIFFSGLPWIIFLVSFLFFHNIMCIGDFAMVSFYIKHKDKELYTFDDHKERTSYIFEKM